MGGILAITGGYQLWRGSGVSTALELRGTLFATTDLGTVLFAFMGYTVRWD